MANFSLYFLISRQLFFARPRQRMSKMTESSITTLSAIKKEENSNELLKGFVKIDTEVAIVQLRQ